MISWGHKGGMGNCMLKKALDFVYMCFYKQMSMIGMCKGCFSRGLTEMSIEIFAHFRLYNYLFEDKHNFNNMN